MLEETSSEMLRSELSKSMKAKNVTGTMFEDHWHMSFTIVSTYPNCGTSTVVCAFRTTVEDTLEMVLNLDPVEGACS